jgi:hypothetical protein
MITEMALLVAIPGGGYTFYRLCTSYRVRVWAETRLHVGEPRPQRISTPTLCRRVANAVSEGVLIGVNGKPIRISSATVGIHPADLSRCHYGAARLAANATSIVVRTARRNGWPIAATFELEVVADRHSIEGSPTLLNTAFIPSSCRTAQAHELAATGIDDDTEPMPYDQDDLTRHEYEHVTRREAKDATEPFEDVELVALDPSGIDIDLASTSGPLTIGRRGCDITITADVVSVRHASIANHHGSWVLSDLGSTNGTWVNGEYVTSAALVHNDEVSFGRGGPRYVFSRLNANSTSGRGRR